MEVTLDGRRAPMHSRTLAHVYDLDELERVCAEMGLPCHRAHEGDELRVLLVEGRTLCFVNLTEDEPPDTMTGFVDTPWHFHDDLVLLTGPATYLTLTPSDLLIGLGVGEIVLVERFLAGAHLDTWLAHRQERLEVDYLKQGEELRIRCLNFGDV